MRIYLYSFMFFIFLNINASAYVAKNAFDANGIYAFKNYRFAAFCTSEKEQNRINFYSYSDGKIKIYKRLLFKENDILQTPEYIILNSNMNNLMLLAGKKNIFVYDINGKLIKKLDIENNITGTSNLSKSMNYLVHSADKLEVYKLNGNEYNKIYEIPVMTNQILISNKDKYLVFTHYNSETDKTILTISELSTGKAIKSFNVPYAITTAFSSSDKYLTLGDKDGNLMLIDLKKFKIVKNIKLKNLEINNIVFSPDDKYIGISHNRDARIYNFSNFSNIKTFYASDNDSSYNINFIGNHQVIVISNNCKKIEYFDINELDRVH